MNEEPLMSEWCLANCFDISIWKIVLHLKTRIEEINFPHDFRQSRMQEIPLRFSLLALPRSVCDIFLHSVHLLLSQLLIKMNLMIIKIMTRLGVYRVSFLWPLDFGIGTWIWDLDLGPGFRTWIWDWTWAWQMLNMKAINGKFCEVITFMQSELWVNYSKWAPNYP